MEQTTTRSTPISPARTAVWLRWGVVALVLVVLALLWGPNLRQLSLNVWLGAVATGLGFACVALGIYLTFRVLNFPDLTVDGSFPLGAAVAATLITSGVNPYLVLPVGFLAGSVAGVATAVIATRLRIHSLLASILVTTSLITINLRIMGRSNIPLLNTDSIFTPFASGFNTLMLAWGGQNWGRMSNNILAILIFLVLVGLVKLTLDWFLHTEIGLAVRATGDNAQMVRALGFNTDRLIILGLALSNGLVGLAGALIAQYQGFADINMGLGLIIAGLAAVILGETLIQPRTAAAATLAVILGMIVYRLAIAAALTVSVPLPWGGKFSIDAQDVKLATALLVLGALAVPHVQRWWRSRNA
jgi:putative tryptophan/tyrosine transport system permease protein